MNSVSFASWERRRFLLNESKCEWIIIPNYQAIKGDSAYSYHVMDSVVKKTDIG